MAAIRVRYETIEFGDADIHVRALRDRQEFQDPEGVASALGICSASWPIFGTLWAAGLELARVMYVHDIEGKRVLEVGCGLGVASLVLNHRGADITATDIHPEAEAFLAANVALNAGPAIPFVRTSWQEEDLELGRFDLIIGSDLLYERPHAELLTSFIIRHARPQCEVIIIDPGRGHGGAFKKAMDRVGFGVTEVRLGRKQQVEGIFRGTEFTFVRKPLPLTA